MAFIDADAHLQETPWIWTFLNEDEKRYEPSFVLRPELDDACWVLDERSRWTVPRVVRDQLMKDSPSHWAAYGEACVSARLASMDQRGIDLQVLFPSFFTEQVTDKPEIELALCRGYNRWMAEVYRLGGGRLRWMAALPLLSMPEAVAMLRACKEQGAVGVMVRPMESRNLLIHDPYFNPLYQAVSDLDLCVGVHAGNANLRHVETLRQGNHQEQEFWAERLPVVGCLHSSAIGGEIAERFPKLRMGFFGAGAGFIPMVVKDLQRRGRPLPRDLFGEYRLYIAVHSGMDDIAYITQYAGADTLLLGTDEGFAARPAGPELVEQRGKLSPEVTEKICYHNARRFYGIEA